MIGIGTFICKTTGTLCMKPWFPIIAIVMLAGFLGMLIYTIVKTNLSLKRMDQIEEEVRIEIKSLRELNK
ncbi:hypothetical protein [Fusibacter bizertensis]